MPLAATSGAVTPTGGLQAAQSPYGQRCCITDQRLHSPCSSRSTASSVIQRKVMQAVSGVADRQKGAASTLNTKLLADSSKSQTAMVALRIALAPPIEPHYAEQLLTTALETAHGTSLSDAMTIAACERFEDATVATVAVRDDALVDVRGALVLAGGPAKASVVVEATAPSVSALPPRTQTETHRLRPFGGYGAGSEAGWRDVPTGERRARTRPGFQTPPRSAARPRGPPVGEFSGLKPRFGSATQPGGFGGNDTLRDRA